MFLDLLEVMDSLHALFDNGVNMSGVSGLIVTPVRYNGVRAMPLTPWMTRQRA